MARTADELLEEEEGEEEVEEEESEDEETVPYNPKNLPLGWDGKVAGRDREGRERGGKSRGGGGGGGGGGRQSLNSNNTHTLTHTHSHTHSPSPTGCTSSMASISPTLVRYAATLHTADQRPSRDTSL